MATAAAIDRVVHHSVILEFDVPSYQTDAAQQRGETAAAEEVNRQNQSTINRQEWLTRDIRSRKCSGHAPRLGLFPSPGRGLVSIVIHWIPMQWMAIHSMTASIPMDRYGYQWNGCPSIGGRGRRRGPERGRGARPDGHGGVGGIKPVIGAISARRGQANNGENARLRTRVRCAIIRVIAHFLPPRLPLKTHRRRLARERR